MFNHLIQMNVQDKRMLNCKPVTKEFFGLLNKDAQDSYTLERANVTANTKIPNIVIVLESPHRNEYDKNGNAIKSASGHTGEKLGEFLSEKINKLRKDQKELGLDCDSYNVYAVNAIQYQCSCGLKPIQPELKNTIFRALWPCLKEDFLNRIKQLNPVLIINMCTGGIKAIGDYIANTANMAKASKYIKNLLSKELPLNLMVHMSLADYVSKMGSIDYYYCVHPSSKNFKRVDLRKV